MQRAGLVYIDKAVHESALASCAVNRCKAEGSDARPAVYINQSKQGELI